MRYHLSYLEYKSSIRQIKKININFIMYIKSISVQFYNHVETF